MRYFKLIIMSHLCKRFHEEQIEGRFFFWWRNIGPKPITKNRNKRAQGLKNHEALKLHYNLLIPKAS